MVDAHDVHLLVLGAPATQLTFDVAVVTRQFTKAGAHDVHVVELRQSCGEVITDDPARGLVKGRFGLGAVAQNRAVDELHDVEGPFVDLFIDAEPQGLRHGNSERIKG